VRKTTGDEPVSVFRKASKEDGESECDLKMWEGLSMVKAHRRRSRQQELPCTQRTLLSFLPPPPTVATVTFGVHPEDQILDLVRSKGRVFLADLPNNLRRTSKWTLNLEKQGFIQRVQVKEKGSTRLLLVFNGQDLGQNVGPKGMGM
jgi:hypothetical protein